MKALILSAMKGAVILEVDEIYYDFCVKVYFTLPVGVLLMCLLQRANRIETNRIFSYGLFLEEYRAMPSPPFKQCK